MSNILTRSPHIVEVSGSGVVGGKVEIFLYKQGVTIPALPQYTLSKLTPASNVTKVFFDVAPYINEFITSNSYTPNVSTNTLNLPIEDYTNVRIKRYKLVATTYTLIDSVDYFGLKGYMEQSISIDQLTNSDLLLAPKTYYYYYNSANPTTIPFGDITLFNTFNFSDQYVYTYTDLVNGDFYQYTIVSAGFRKIYKVYPTYASHGNKLEITNDRTGLLIATYYFRPIEECRYTPVTLDFINKYGAWQREFLFKNSTDSINVESQAYKNYRAIPNVFNVQETLVTSFNTNGTESIKTNTGWVNEDFKDTIKQILLSDRILVNNRPATITTKQVDLQKNINNKLINYALDFQFSNSII
jgi:hypothetical protein